MKKKHIVLTAAATALSVMLAVPAYAAGWDRDERGYWYLFDNGAYARDQIIAIDGVNYGFNPEAYMVEGWYYYQSNWYYFAPGSGAQVLGWLQLDNKWYYLNPSNGGIMQTGWLDIGRNRYYLDESGVMKVGAFNVDGYYYYAEDDGSLRRNTTETENGISIRYDENGRQMYRNPESELNGKNGGEVWLPVLEQNALLEQRSEIQSSNAEFISQTKLSLYDDFKDYVSRSKNDNDLQKRIEKWKVKAAKKLAELSVSQAEIDVFLDDAVHARLDGDRGMFNYNYTETNEDGSTTTHTYTYWSDDYKPSWGEDEEEEEETEEEYDENYDYGLNY